MEDREKYIIIGLAAVLLISIFINFQTYSAKKAVQRERDDLKNENASLTKQLDEGRKEKQKLEEKITALNTDLDKLTQQDAELKKQNDELQKRYDTITKERNELIEKLKAQQQPVAQAEAEAQKSAAEEAYWAKVLKAKTELEAKLTELRNDLKNAQMANAQLGREKSILELDFNNLTRDKKELEQHLRTVDSTTLDLVQEKTANLKIQETLRTIKAENAALRRKLKTLSAYRNTLEKKVQQLQTDKTGLERKFDEMEALLENRFAQVSDLKQQLDTIRSGGQLQLEPPKKESVELPPIVVYPQPQTQAATPAPAQEELGVAAALAPRSGKVLTVDRENNFVVVDLGEDTGIKTGDTLHVYREDQAIATIQVIQTRKTVSACDIKREMTPIKADDKVR